MHFTGMTPSGHELHWDSGPKDAVTEGATPMESILQAVGICCAMDVVAILKKRRKEPTVYDVEVEGVRSEDHPRVFTDISIVHRVGGDGIIREEVEKAIRLSLDKYCSVLKMITPKVKVDCSIEII